MKSPIDTIRGRIVGYDSRTSEILIRARYDDVSTLCKREYKDCNVELIDSRRISSAQRRSCYKLMSEIAEFSGEGTSKVKEALKKKFVSEELYRPEMEFSLSDCSVSLACAFQKYLIRFILDYEIPCSFNIIDFVDDIYDYIYSCALRKKCCVCGQHAEGHHWDRIGIRHNRILVDQSGMRMEPLCRGHHTECHTMIQEEFDEKYKIGPVYIDDAIKAVYGYSGTRQRFEGYDDRDLNEEKTVSTTNGGK